MYFNYKNEGVFSSSLRTIERGAAFVPFLFFQNIRCNSALANHEGFDFKKSISDVSALFIVFRVYLMGLGGSYAFLSRAIISLRSFSS